MNLLADAQRIRVGICPLSEHIDRAAAPFDATLDIAVSAPNRIFVRGRVSG